MIHEFQSTPDNSFHWLHCPWCNRVKQYLKEKGFRFREVNVERDRDGARELQHRHIMGVPLVLIGSHPIVGFDKAKIDKLLGIEK
mgnify:CR=1 FL=1